MWTMFDRNLPFENMGLSLSEKYSQERTKNKFFPELYLTSEVIQVIGEIRRPIWDEKIL